MERRKGWLKGVVVPVATPFNNKEDVDAQALRGLVDFLIEKDVNCLFPLGGTSEFYRLSLNERRKAIDTIIDQANGRVPVMPGVHTLSTKLSIEMAEYAKNAGANAVVILQPYFDELSEEQLFQHYRDICEAVDIPVMLYAEQGVVNEPSLELISKLVELENVIGIKLSTCDICRFQRGVEMFGDKIAVLAGIEDVFIPGLMSGGVGGVIGTANFCPEYWVEMYNLFLKDEVREAIELQKRFSRVTYDLISEYGYHEVIKEALNLRGVKVGRTRRPGVTLTMETREKIKEMLIELGLIT